MEKNYTNRECICSAEFNWKFIGNVFLAVIIINLIFIVIIALFAAAFGRRNSSINYAYDYHNL